MATETENETARARKRGREIDRDRVGDFVLVSVHKHIEVTCLSIIWRLLLENTVENAKAINSFHYEKKSS